MRTGSGRDKYAAKMKAINAMTYNAYLGFIAKEICHEFTDRPGNARNEHDFGVV